MGMYSKCSVVAIGEKYTLHLISDELFTKKANDRFLMKSFFFFKKPWLSTWSHNPPTPPAALCVCLCVGVVCIEQLCYQHQTGIYVGGKNTEAILAVSFSPSLRF